MTTNETFNQRSNAEAKSRIIEDLKANESRKAAATASLNAKLTSLTQELDANDAALIKSLTGSLSSEVNDSTVYDKPMQGHSTGGGNLDTSAYDKPMQGHSTGGGNLDTSANDKPIDN